MAYQANIVQASPTNQPTAVSPVINQQQPLPLVQLPTKLDKNDEQALALISKASLLPVKKTIFPSYRPRAYGENENPISAWSAQEYKEILALQKQSEMLRQLPINQLMALESLLGGVNKHGMLTALQWKTTETYHSATTINIDADNADSLLAAMPASWHTVGEQVNEISGNQSKQFAITDWKAAFGDVQTQEVIRTFSTLEREKGRPREVWTFSVSENDWYNKISTLKKQLKPLGYETYALDTELKRQFFSNRKEAEACAQKLHPGTAAKIIQEGPAELVIDKEANVISTSGQVVHRELDPASKKRCEDLENQSKFFRQITSFFGVKGFVNSGKFVGIRFQFSNYPTNWIPPQSKIEKLSNNQLKISVPQRFSITTQVREAFAIKNFDQYKFLVARGITAINYGMSGKDVISRIKRWDAQYGVSVLKADWDYATVRFEKLPPDLKAFEKELKQFCPSAANGYDLERFKNERTLNLWWD